MTGPLVDVIIPTRNRSSLLLEAIRSVREQTCSAWRLLVVDDGSDDGSLEEVRDTLADDTRIQLIARAERGGPQAARQTGFEASEARYIAILDSDDLWDPTKLEKQLACFNGQRELIPQLGAVLCWHQWTDLSGHPRSPIRKPQAQGVVGPLVATNMSTIMITHEALDAAGGFLPDGLRSLFTCEGVEFYVRLTERCEFAVIPEMLVRCRHHGGPRANHYYADGRDAEELEYVMQVHSDRFAEYDNERARLRGRIAARYLSAGFRRQGLEQLGSALRDARMGYRLQLARKYGPFVLKALIAKPKGPRQAPEPANSTGEQAV